LFSLSDTPGDDISRHGARKDDELAEKAGGRYQRNMDPFKERKEMAARAMARGQWPEAFRLYGKLAELEPLEGTWALRTGDAARRLGRTEEAVTWYGRAVRTYKEQGLVLRAIAVAKMVEAVQPGNDGELRALDAAQQGKGRPGRQPSEPCRETPEPTSPGEGPPLNACLRGPELQPSTALGKDLPSVEIVFDDVDDGLPINDSEMMAAGAGETTLPSKESEQRQALVQRLPPFPLFDVLPRGAFLAVVSEMEHRRLTEGEIVFRQGERGRALFAVIEGQALAYRQGHRDRPLGTLGPGEIFGEMALALDRPRGATVEALTELELFEMDRELFRDMLTDHPQVALLLSKLIKRRLVENVLATAPLLQGLDRTARNEIMSRFEIRDVPPETKFVDQGHASDGLYLLVDGEITKLREGNRAGQVEPGQSFGGASLLDSRHRAQFTFVAERRATVLRLPRRAFMEVMKACPWLWEQLNEQLGTQSGPDSGQVPVV
jgi:cAMP-dependent protein kinase regulator